MKQLFTRIPTYLLRLLFVFILANQTQAQAPAGYYDGASGKTGQELKEALHHIIDNHTVLSYDALGGAFADTDARADCTVWDMYSDNPNGTNPYEYAFGSDACGHYSTPFFMFPLAAQKALSH